MSKAMSGFGGSAAAVFAAAEFKGIVPICFPTASGKAEAVFFGGFESGLSGSVED